VVAAQKEASRTKAEMPNISITKKKKSPSALSTTKILEKAQSFFSQPSMAVPTINLVTAECCHHLNSNTFTFVDNSEIGSRMSSTFTDLGMHARGSSI
jgi:hypothetical protein